MDKYTATEQAYKNGYERGKNDAAEHERCQYCRAATYTDKPFKVITQRGKEVYVQFKYCPNCGSKI